MLIFQNRHVKGKQDYPPGRLKIGHKFGTAQYYRVQNDSDTGDPAQEIRKYIRKKDSQFAVLLAQKSHDIKLLKELKKRKEAIDRLIETYSETDPYAIWDSFCEERKNLVLSDYVSDERYAEEWQAKQYQPKGFRPETPEIYIGNCETRFASSQS